VVSFHEVKHIGIPSHAFQPVASTFPRPHICCKFSSRAFSRFFFFFCLIGAEPRPRVSTLARVAWLFQRSLSSSTRKGTRNLKQQTLNDSCGIGDEVNTRHFKLLLQFPPTSARSQGPSSLTSNTLAIPHTHSTAYSYPFRAVLT
jgi:hypothetical protein